MKIEATIGSDLVARAPTARATPQERFDAVMAERSRLAAELGQAPDHEGLQDGAPGRAFGFSELGVFGSIAAVGDASQSPVSSAAPALVERGGLGEPAGAGAAQDRAPGAAADAQGAKLASQGPAALSNGAPPSVRSAAEGPPPEAMEWSSTTLITALAEPAEPPDATARGPAPVAASDGVSETATPAPATDAAASAKGVSDDAGASVIVASSPGAIHVLVEARGLGSEAALRLRRAAKDIAAAYSMKVGSMHLNGSDAAPPTTANNGTDNASFSC